MLRGASDRSSAPPCCHCHPALSSIMYKVKMQHYANGVNCHISLSIYFPLNIAVMISIAPSFLPCLGCIINVQVLLLTFISAPSPNVPPAFPLLVVIHFLSDTDSTRDTAKAGSCPADGRFLWWVCWGSELTSQHASPWSFTVVPGDRRSPR